MNFFLFVYYTVGISDIIDFIRLFGAIKMIRFTIIGVISGRKLDLVGAIKVNFIIRKNKNN